MEKKINIAELLRDCPKGMELDCTMFDYVTFERFDVEQNRCYFKAGPADTFWTTCYGAVNDSPFSKCVIFPKGKTTWEGFQRPFKDGDIVFYNDTIAIFEEWGDETLFRTYVSKYLCCESFIDIKVPLFGKSIRKEARLATEEEKQKLFDAIKANGYKWNAETKTLEELAEPKFKVGDKVVFRDAKEKPLTIRKIWWDCQAKEILCSFEEDDIDVPVEDLDRYIKPKFNINTLKPFESRVLVRDSVKEPWKPDFFGCLCGSNNYMVVGGIMWKCCIPYKNNEHLLWTTDDCNDFYKTWE